MRSALFVPGNSERKLAKAADSGADALFIDLEDSVSPAEKEDARTLCAEWLGGTSRREFPGTVYVRVNAFDTEMTTADLETIMPHAPHGIVLPKSEHGSDVTRLDAWLRVQEAENNLDDGRTRIVAIVTETAIGTLNAGTYRRSSSRLDGIAWGAEDLSADIGALHRRKPDGTYRDLFRFARIQTLLGAVAAGVQPLDTVFTDFRDQDGLRHECQEAASDGFTGKMAIHPAQVPVINAVFTPSGEDVDRAQRIVEAFEEADGVGVIALDGQMLDIPHLKRATKLLERAQKT